MLALLSEQFSSSSFDRRLGGHTIVFGADEVRVIFKSGTRRILKIEASPSLTSATRRHLQARIKTALASDAPSKIASRVVMSQGPFNRGPFRWCGQLQVGRMPKGAPEPAELGALYPVLVQYRFPKVGMTWLDAVRRDMSYRRAFLPLVPITHHFNCGLLDMRQSTVQHTWVLVRDADERLTNRYAQMDYFMLDALPEDGFHEFTDPSVAELSAEGMPEFDCFQQSLREWLVRLDTLPPDTEEQFLRGCFWFNKALTERSRTDRLLALIIMVESFLPQAREGQCDRCSQPVFSVSKRFRDFLARHAGPPKKAPADQHDRFRGFSTRLYTVAHGGFAVAAEHLGFGIGFVPKDIGEDDLVSDLATIGSRLLLSWLLERSESPARA